MCPSPRARSGTAPVRIDKAPGIWLLTHRAAPQSPCSANRFRPRPRRGRMPQVMTGARKTDATTDRSYEFGAATRDDIAGILHLQEQNMRARRIAVGAFPIVAHRNDRIVDFLLA